MTKHTPQQIKAFAGLLTDGHLVLQTRDSLEYILSSLEPELSSEIIEKVVLVLDEPVALALKQRYETGYAAGMERARAKVLMSLGLK